MRKLPDQFYAALNGTFQKSFPVKKLFDMLLISDSSSHLPFPRIAGENSAAIKILDVG